MRKQLKDPGFFRWPPHSNLMYPFLDVSPKETDNAKVEEILEQLRSATQQIEPFPVRLQQLGTFGGKQRGVLWLKPDSSLPDDNAALAPLLALHKKLEEAFPICKDQTKGGKFTPHMTISHFVNLADAKAAQATIEDEYREELEGDNLTFLLDRIYLLHRKGDGGQFLRMAEIGLGAHGQVEALRPAQAFAEQPTEEEQWVYEERMKQKARRNGGGGRGRGGRRKQQRRRRSRGLRVPDTPEVIAAKRAERKAKRERLESQLKGTKE